MAVDACLFEAFSLTIISPAAGGVSAPTTPTTLRVTSVSATNIAFAWNASTDNKGVTGYEIFNAAGTKVGFIATAAISAGDISRARSMVDTAVPM